MPHLSGIRSESAQGDEIENSLAASQNGDYSSISPPRRSRNATRWTSPSTPGSPASRESARRCSRGNKSVTFAGALGRPGAGARPAAASVRAGDRWLGAGVPAQATELDKDRLLYTAHFARRSTKPRASADFCVDEWTETIPTSSVDTGIVFHHDRPNCEAPQAMLLVTPSEFRGAWRWDDWWGAERSAGFRQAPARSSRSTSIDSPYAPFLPATVVATQVQQLTIARRTRAEQQDRR